MHLSLDYPQLNAWLSQQEFGATSTFDLAQGITLSFQKMDGSGVLELAVEQSLVSLNWLNDVLEKRFTDLERYRDCIPVRKTENAWILRFISPTGLTAHQDGYIEQGVLPLISLAGIEVHSH